MTAERSIRYDLGLCAVDYVAESEFYRNVTMRFRQAVGRDEAQVTLTAADAERLAMDLLKELSRDPSVLVQAQLSGQTMTADTRC